jgi:hypothetical protein
MMMSFCCGAMNREGTYEYLTAARYGKRATLSALLPAPQDPTEDAFMTESFVLTSLFFRRNT